MTATKKKPPIIESVGAQYFAFATVSSSGDFDGTYDAEVIKIENVKSVSVTENGAAAQPIYASGVIYSNISEFSTANIETEALSQDEALQAKMRGDDIATNKLVQSGGKQNRPFFAYGKVVKFSDGTKRFDWYPKCQLSSNSDEAATKTDSFSEQTVTNSILALPFDDKHVVNRLYDADIETMTEELFFAQPILTPKNLDDIIPAPEGA
jgi:hypothetical protein